MDNDSFTKNKKNLHTKHLEGSLKTGAEASALLASL